VGECRKSEPDAVRNYNEWNVPVRVQGGCAYDKSKEGANDFVITLFVLCCGMPMLSSECVFVVLVPKCSNDVFVSI